MVAPVENYQEATISYRKDHADDLWTLRVRPQERLAFKPGQYATLGIEQGGRIIDRATAI